MDSCHIEEKTSKNAKSTRKRDVICFYCLCWLSLFFGYSLNFVNAKITRLLIKNCSLNQKREKSNGNILDKPKPFFISPRKKIRIYLWWYIGVCFCKIANIISSLRRKRREDLGKVCLYLVIWFFFSLRLFLCEECAFHERRR